MKQPKTPPQSLDILKDTKRLEAVLSKIRDHSIQPRKYLHWNELIYRKPPEGLSHEEWWFALKLGRSGSSQLLPLKDAGGKPFVWTTWHELPMHLNEIDRGFGGVIETPEPILNRAYRDRYIIRSLVEEAITSSQLEGAVTTRPVAKEMIRSGRPPRNKSERMILNNYQTMQMIREDNNDILTPGMVLQIHREITNQTLDDAGAAGRFRTSDEHVRVEDEYGTVFHVPPPANELGKRLETMCDFANQKSPEAFIHPVLRAITLHFWLAFDHPFVDGNGRVARALFYWSMLKNKYWLCEFISISQLILRAPAQYYRAFLYTENDDNDVTYFLVHQLGVIREAMKRLHRYLSRQSQRMTELRTQLRGIERLNHRQRALIDHALTHPYANYTIEAHQVSHNVVYETARTDLLSLADAGLLVVNKVGRTLHFQPNKDLDVRLARSP